MPGMPTPQRGALDTKVFHPRHIESDCWGCGLSTNLTHRLADAWEFYCPTCEVTWREPG